MLRLNAKRVSVVVRFAGPREAKFTPSLEAATEMLEVPLNVLPAKLTDQLLPVSGTCVRSASNTTLTALLAIIASGLVKIWPSSLRTENESKSTEPGASRFDASEPPVACDGTNC